MAKKVMVIGVTTLDDDISLTQKTPYTEIYFKGLNDFNLLSFKGADIGNNLTITLNNHDIVLTDYFSKNGKFPVKTITTDSLGTPLINLVDYVNDNYIKGAKQNIDGGVARSINGTVFDDIIQAGATNQTINAGSGNDTIYASDGNDVLVGGLGKNFIKYEYEDEDTKFGSDTIKLTKGEELHLYIKDENGDFVTPKFTKGTGRGANDLIITNDIVSTDKITLQNYYGKDTGATVLINGKDLSKEAYFIFDEDDIKSSSFTSSALADNIDASNVHLTKTIGKGKNKQEVPIGIKINSASGDDIIKGTNSDDTITSGAGNNTILLDTENKFGDDIIVLTKDEKLNLKLEKEEDADKVSYEINGKDLVVTVNENNENLKSTITIKNYTSKDILTSSGALKIVDKNGNELINLRDAIYTETFMDSESGHLNKNSYTGTWIDEHVNASNYSVKNVTIDTPNYEKVKGVTVNLGGSTTLGNTFKGSIYADTIKATSGHNNIEGGKGNDIITAGNGNNYIHYSKGDGADTINLSKGEEFTLVLKDIDENEVKYAYTNKNNDLKIYYEQDGKEAGSITLKGFGKKDIVGDNGDVKLQFKDSISPISLKSKIISADINKQNYTGSWLNDYIDASDSDELLKNKKHVNMVLDGGAGTDIIVGSNYADTLKARSGTGDILTGGEQNDILYGSSTKDSCTTFIFRNGDGNDIVYGGKGADTLQFNNTLPSDLKFEKKGNDLIVKYNHFEQDQTLVAQDSVTIKNYYNRNKVVSTVKYINVGGRTFDIETLKGYADKNVIIDGSGNIDGTANDDVIIATGNTYQQISALEGNNTVYASNYAKTDIVLGDGDDIIYAPTEEIFETSNYYTGSGSNTVYMGDNNIVQLNLGNGNDTVYTGKAESVVKVIGLDTLNGGHDTIYWSGNSDQRIEFASLFDNIGCKGHKLSDLSFTKSQNSNDLVIWYGDNNSVTLKDYYKFGNEAMSDLTISVLNDLEQNTDLLKLSEAIDANGGVKIRLIDSFDGTENNDYIIGTDNAETIYGNGGNDLIVPNGGDDTIYLGSGNDTVIAGNGNKEIKAQFGDNIISLGSGDNKVLLGTGSDTVKSGSGANEITFIEGDTGNDTYIFNAEKTEGKKDKFIFEDDSTSSLTLDIRDSENLVLTRNYGEGNTVTIKNYTDTDRKTGITVIGTNDSLVRLFDLPTIAGISDSNEAQTIVTGGESDTIYSGYGSDSINAGGRNNTIYLTPATSGNNDTYTYAGGNDTFILNGIDNLNALTMIKNNNDLIVGYVGNVANNTLTISNYFATNFGGAEKIRFQSKNETKTIAELVETKSYTETITCQQEGHNIDKHDVDHSVIITGCNQADTIVGTAKPDSINGNGGGDTLMGGGESDTYIVDADAYGIAHDIIDDASGENDKLLLGSADGEANVFFEVTQTGVLTNGNVSYTQGNELYINKSSNYDFSNAKISNGIEIKNYNTTGKIEHIRNLADDTDIFDGRLFGAIGQTVANWLYNNGKTSVSQVIDSGTSEEKAALLKLYKPIISAETSINGTTNDDLIIATGKSSQQITEEQGNNIVYASNHAENNIILGDGNDIIYAPTEELSGESTYYTGNGNNTIYMSNMHSIHLNLGSGNDTVYLENGSSTVNVIGYNNLNGKDDTIYWGGNSDQRIEFAGLYNNTEYIGHKLSDLSFTRTGESSDLVIRYAVNNSVTLKDYYKAGNEDMANVGLLAMSDNNSGFEIPTIGDAITTTGGVMNYLNYTTGSQEGTSNADYIYAGENVIGIQASGGSDTVVVNGYTEVYTNINTSNGKDLTEGIIDTVLLNGSYNHTIHAQSETNILTSTGTSNDYYYAYIDQNTIISDAAGIDNLTIENSPNQTDGAHTGLHVVFNISQYMENIESDSMMVLDDTNYEKWQTSIYDPTIIGVKIKGENISTIEKITASDGYYLDSDTLNNLQSTVAAWLVEDDKGLANVGEALDGDYKDAFITLMTENTLWQPPQP